SDTPKTVTVNDFFVVFPAASFAVQVTVVVFVERFEPRPNVDPDAGEHVVVTDDGGLGGSVAVVVNVTTAPFGAVALTLMFAGTLSTGGVLSCWFWSVIVTVKDFVAVLFRVSFAVQVIVVVPTGNFDPDARPAVGEETQVGVIDPLTRSTAVGAVK